MQQFFEAVRALERRLTAEAERSLPPLSLVSPERMQEQLAQGLPLLPLVPPVLPAEQYFRDLGEYRALLCGYEPALVAEMQAQERALSGADVGLLHALLFGENDVVYERAVAMGASPERLYFLGELALRPYLAVYAERLESVVNFTGYRGGRCPVCGRQAHMGRIDADNVKHLHCPACESTWRFGRVECSNCGSTSPGKLGFFTVEGDEEHRVEHCSECGHYLKVINQRIQVRQVDLLLADAATYYLDRLAEREGYRKGGRPVLA
jgi:formate dehydrogenase accessory protein FdhE